MRTWPVIALLLLAGCIDRQAQLAEDALRAGNAKYKASEFAAAQQDYESALFDPRVRHNAGKAAYRSGDLPAATNHLAEVPEMFTDPNSSASAYHDLGNAWLLRSKEADSLGSVLSRDVENVHADQQDIAGRLRAAVVRDSLRRKSSEMYQLVDSALTTSINAYEQALRRVPTDEDTRYNLALALSLQKQNEEKRNKDKDKKDEQLSERARQLMAKADQLVDEYKFKEALDLLTKGLQEDPSLQQKKEYMDKLEVVTKAAEAQ